MTQQTLALRSLTIPTEAAGQRLDRYLTIKLSPLSRARLQHWIKGGHVRLDGRVHRPNYRIRGGEMVEIAPPRPGKTRLVAEEIPLEIVYEDDAMVVVNKAPGMVVHPGAGQNRGTLVNALLAQVKGLSGVGGIERPGIVHRLDKGTSGLIIVAKNDAAHQSLARQFAERTVVKVYLALCYGKLAASGIIDLPVGRHPTERKKMSTKSRRAREALTHWRVREYFGTKLSLAEVNIKTGRTHQIRVHLAAGGHSLVGDDLYGGKGMVRRLPKDWQELVGLLVRPALHAWQLKVKHPTTGKSCQWKAPLPDDLAMLLQECRRLSKET